MGSLGRFGGPKGCGGRGAVSDGDLGQAEGWETWGSAQQARSSAAVAVQLKRPQYHLFFVQCGRDGGQQGQGTWAAAEQVQLSRAESH